MSFLVLIFVGFLMFAIWALFYSLLMALPVMLLWNAVVPDIFHLQQIGFFQAFLLSLLCSFLFKSSQASSKKDD